MQLQLPSKPYYYCQIEEKNDSTNRPFTRKALFILFYFILFYFILFYFILFYFILFYFILF